MKTEQLTLIDIEEPKSTEQLEIFAHLGQSEERQAELEIAVDGWLNFPFRPDCQ